MLTASHISDLLMKIFLLLNKTMLTQSNCMCECTYMPAIIIIIAFHLKLDYRAWYKQAITGWVTLKRGQQCRLTLIKLILFCVIFLFFSIHFLYTYLLILKKRVRARTRTKLWFITCARKFIRLIIIIVV